MRELFPCCECRRSYTVALGEILVVERHNAPPAMRVLIDARNAVAEAMGVAVLPIRLDRPSRETCHACASGREIIFAESFVFDAFNNYGRDAVVGAVAHEIDHVVAGHTLQRTIDFAEAWLHENEADLFAARALARLGRPVDPFARLLTNLGGDGDAEHPPGIARAVQIRAVWRREQSEILTAALGGSWS